MIRSATSILLFVCSATYSLDFEWDRDVVKKYSEMKMLNGCLGENFLPSWKESVMAASEKCHGEETSAQKADFLKILKNDKQLLRELLGIRQEDAPTPKPQKTHKVSPQYLLITPQSPSYATKQPVPIQAPPKYLYDKIPNQHSFEPLINLPFSPVKQHNFNSFKSPSYPQPAYPQPAYPQPAYPQPAYPQPAYPQPAYPQPAYHQPAYAQSADHEIMQSLLQPNFAPIRSYLQRPMDDYHVYQQSPRIWWKRSMDDAPEGRRNSKDMRIESLDRMLLQNYPQINIFKQRIASKISNITCVLKNMELIDEDGLPNYKYNTELLHRMDIPSSLRSNLLEAQDFCKDFSMCVPVHRMSDPIVMELGNSFVFLKCMKQMIFHACLANDFVQSNLLSQFGFDTQARSSIIKDLVTDKEHNPIDTVTELETLLDNENDISFGF